KGELLYLWPTLSELLEHWTLVIWLAGRPAMHVFWSLRPYVALNIIKKVSGQKFVYKFVSQPDPAPADGPRGAEEVPKKDACDPISQLKGLGGVASRPAPGGAQKSSRNDYMKSGLYSTFTIQSLQAPPNPRPIKSELLLQPDPAPKAREVRPLHHSSSSARGAMVFIVSSSQVSLCWFCCFFSGFISVFPSEPFVATVTCSSSSSASTSPSCAGPPKPKKPRILELPSSPSLPPGLSLDKVNAAVNSLLAPGAPNTLTPTVITSHALTPVLLTPSALPSTIHFWSTLSPIAPRSPAKLSFQFPANGSNQIHIPALSVDGLSTPVVLSPGPQKP
uniref:Uncharacterized protein n=1 Tax=Xiphophorus couchianus TaxID=32473 RepID=A0A3B5MN54_9TELE